jgi:hypothetical protein
MKSMKGIKTPTGGYMMTDEQYWLYLKARIIIALGKFF